MRENRIAISPTLELFVTKAFKKLVFKMYLVCDASLLGLQWAGLFPYYALEQEVISLNSKLT